MNDNDTLSNLFKPRAVPAVEFPRPKSALEQDREDGRKRDNQLAIQRSQYIKKHKMWQSQMDRRWNKDTKKAAK